MVDYITMAWPAQLLIQDRPIRGLYLPRRGAASVGLPERIYVLARGTLGNIVRTVGHELRHVYQSVYGGPSEWIGGRWVDTSTLPGAEIDAYAHADAITVPAWMETHQVEPIYDR